MTTMPWWEQRDDIMTHLDNCVDYSYDFHHPDDIFVVGWNLLTDGQQDKLVLLRLKVLAEITTEDPDKERIAFTPACKELP